jgi:acetylxylan esterase
LLTASAVAIPNPDPAAQPEAAHQLGRRYTDQQIHNTTSQTTCSDVHLIVDRATGEPPSQGVIGTLATEITTRLPGTTVEWVNYPAVLVPYDQSTNSGIEMTKSAIQKYADSCPNAKIVLLGYSQGAQVVGDVMCGGGGAFGLGPFTDPLADQYVKRIAAVVQMGDPRFMPGNDWDFGTAVTGGVGLRDELCRSTD